MKVLLTADGHVNEGGSTLVLHNEQLADPLNEHARAVAEIAKKRNKTEADHLEIGRREFHGGLYLNGNGPCVPAWNILRCLQDGAKRHRRGPDVLRGIYPLAEHADLQYDGPRDPDEMWKLGPGGPPFCLRKSVGIQGRSRTIRTRPMFNDWRVELPVEVDATVWDVGTLRHIWKDAGIYAGLGEMRPVFGRFLGTLEEQR